MACNKISTSKLFTCLENTAGIRKMWIANFEDVDSVTISATTSKVDAITMVAGSPVPVFYEYNFEKTTAELNVAAGFTKGNGTKGFPGTFKSKFYKNEQANFLQLESLAYNNTMIVVEDLNDKLFLLGEKNNCNVQGINVSWGVATTDFNGQEITWEFDEKKLPIELASKAVILAVS